MDDLISRQAVKELAHNQMREKYCGMALKKQRDFYIKLADSIIDLLPAVHPEPHWIPVDLENNEPPLEEWVLVSGDGYVMQDCIVERGGEKIWYHGGNIQSDDRYIPLPEPYKGVTT